MSVSDMSKWMRAVELKIATHMEAMRARSVGPTAAQERYEFLDVLRGVALAGIVLANMISLSLPLLIRG